MIHSLQAQMSSLASSSSSSSSSSSLAAEAPPPPLVVAYAPDEGLSFSFLRLLNMV